MAQRNLTSEQRTAMIPGDTTVRKMGCTIPGFRYIILIVSALCLTSLLSNMTTYNFTKICMLPTNGTKGEVELEYDKNQQSWLQASVAIGALTASFPYTYMFNHYTKKWVFLSAGIISAVSTALVPLAHTYGFKFFLLARTFQGVAFSATFPIMGAVTADWAVLTEHGLFVGLLTGCTQLSNVFTMPVSGALCSSSWGWPSVYYVHAGVSIIAFALIIDETTKVRVYNSLALVGSAIFFAILAFIPQENHVTAIVILVFAESLLGLNTAGFNKCATLHSRQYGHFVMTQIMNIWAVTILLEPFVVNAIVAANK
ncbi:hypothetical protein GCK32_013177 [Trichostrongylus colubriformis]|uniref:Major facilitator superfamily (MFS) profile domain-containing protein n=1 Tax=Trichostrongylus colubriformis TaxID=6319 RepID=A0AAN8FHA4_TRICO